MKKLMLNIMIVALMLVATPMSSHAGTGWTTYKPGVVKSAITRGKTVLLGYLSSY